MRFLTLACDYDGTLATDGVVSGTSLAALDRLRASGRRAILVTGRHTDDLKRVFQRLDLFDRVVVENGAVVFDPKAPDRVTLLAEPLPPTFTKALSKRGVPYSVGHAIVATVRPYETTVLEVIRELGLDLEIIFNLDAVMILPAGTTKQSGLETALHQLKLSRHNVVGIGDGENDHAFLRASECAVAVANAVPSLKDAADWITHGERGRGVEELIDSILDDDLEFLDPRLERHAILLGHTDPGEPVRLRPYRTALLVIGPSKSGKSTLTLGILERLAAVGYQYCLVDPEGDYEAMPGAVHLGTQDRPPDVVEVLDILDRPDQSTVVSLLALPAEERPRFFAALLSRIDDLRIKTARPHWLVIDEVHHVLPADWAGIEQVVPQTAGGLVMIGLNPSSVSRAALRLANTVCALGEEAAAGLREYAMLVGANPPRAHDQRAPNTGQALLWRRGEEHTPLMRIEPSTIDRKRHRRKYAEGELPPERSFYFRGPDLQLRLRAHNLTQFLELADGVDDATWLYHLRLGDYSTWIRTQIKSEGLANRIAEIERDERLSADESRRAVREAIEERFAPPA